jgi:hypothetical protein
VVTAEERARRRSKKCSRSSRRVTLDLPQAFGGTFDAHDDILAGLAIRAAPTGKRSNPRWSDTARNYSGDYWNASAAPPEFRETRR